jgi:hypothetical protein
VEESLRITPELFPYKSPAQRTPFKHQSHPCLFRRPSSPHHTTATQALPPSLEEPSRSPGAILPFALDGGPPEEAIAIAELGGGVAAVSPRNVCHHCDLPRVWIPSIPGPFRATPSELPSPEHRLCLVPVSSPWGSRSATRCPICTAATLHALSSVVCGLIYDRD